MVKAVKVCGFSNKWNVKTIEDRIKRIDKLIHRPIRWDIILQYAKNGELRSCEICGEKERGGYWCHPCIHPTWCCICCILLGIPNYATSMWIIGDEAESSK